MISKANLIAQIAIYIKNGIMIYTNGTIKVSFVKKNVMIGILALVFMRMGIIKKVVNVTDSVSVNVTNTLSTNVTNTLSTNVTSTVSINSDDKKVRYEIACYILHTFFLENIMLLIIAIICHHYRKNSSKKHIGTLAI